MGDRWPSDVWTGLLQVRERLLAILPGLLVLLSLLALGLLLAWLARAVVSRGSRAVGVDRAFERWGLASSLRRSGIVRLPAGSDGAHVAARGRGRFRAHFRSHMARLMPADAPAGPALRLVVIEDD